MPQESVNSSLQKISNLLMDVRKEAGEEPNNTSFMETAAATPAAQSEDAPSNDNPEASKVNKEKTDEAEAVGGNIGSVAENKDSDVQPAQVPEKTDGPDQMSADEPVTGSGQMGSINHQDTSMDQKVAAMHRGIGLISNYLGKYASKVEEAPEAAPAKEAAEEGDELFAEIEKIASEQAENYKSALISGMLLRIQDHLNIKEAMDNGALSKEQAQQIEELGGIEGFLDKVAMENPEAILPPEIEDTDEGGDDMPEEGGEDLGGEGEEGLEGADLSEEDLAAIEQMLAEAGVTEEDLAASIGDVQSLAEAGASPEEAAEATDMLMAEQLGGEKVASDNPRVKACYEFLKEAQEARKAK